MEGGAFHEAQTEGGMPYNQTWSLTMALQTSTARYNSHTAGYTLKLSYRRLLTAKVAL